MGKILVIDTNEKFCRELSHAAKRLGHSLRFANTFFAGFQALQIEPQDVVVLNSHMPDGSGVDAIASLKQIPATPEIIIITDSGDPDEAEVAIKYGVWDYVPRPPKAKLLIPLIVSVLRCEIEKTVEESRSSLRAKHFEGILGGSVQMKACLELAAGAADADTPVLMKGEAGTGKELLALAIHKNSPRANNNFVVVDCTTLKEAGKLPREVIAQAAGGTLFLDEVGELPVSIQKSFLRAFHRQRNHRAEGKEKIGSTFRLITASSRNLDEMVQKAEFNEDFLFCIRSLTIELPPLRQRREDINGILGYHLPKICGRLKGETKELSPEFLEALHRYQWPGNVRELVNALEGSIVAAKDESLLLPQHLPMYLRVHLARASVSDGEARTQTNACTRFGASHMFPTLQALRDAAIEKAEREYFQELKVAAKGDIQKACELSNLSPSRLYALLKKYKKKRFTAEVTEDAE
ncbi:MAG: sigma-54-dependent Fis family transcriptional regulator [Ignavibacteriales bacterium]|nr:sigma-54-dependent Fis family transcriptional regulator [Ignavibacteriales bacterium]